MKIFKIGHLTDVVYTSYNDCIACFKIGHANLLCSVIVCERGPVGLGLIDAGIRDVCSACEDGHLPMPRVSGCV